MTFSHDLKAPASAAADRSETASGAAPRAVRQRQSRRNPHAVLDEFRVLLERQKLEEHLVARQHAPRQDLLENLVARQQANELTSKLGALHPADIAFVLEGLPPGQRSRLWHLVPPHLDGAVLIEVSDSVRKSLLKDMDRKEILDSAKEMGSDHIADLIEQLPPTLAKELMADLPPTSRDQVQHALSFPKESVGALMDFEQLVVHENETIESVLGSLRQRGTLPPNTHSLMVVDDGGVLKGLLTFEALLVQDPGRLVREAMDADPISFRTDDEAAEAASAFERYELSVAPVVNAHHQLVGRLTADAVFEQAMDSAQQDLLAQAGLDRDEDLFAGFWTAARRRWLWLAINMTTAFIASRVIGVFDDSIERIVALAALMPIVASIGGNTGNQAVALTVRGLSLGQIDSHNALHLIAKELKVSAINGAIWGSIMGVFTWMLYGEPVLGAVMTAAMTLNMLLAALVGIGIPFLLNAVGRDPALGSSIILTFLTDAGGFFIFLGLATLAFPG